ncbi:MAG: T9SS type A sorting domain-containing protein [Bacteroidota bacterium]|nr:T9SS type A sorting domain-containing protein [Bacteroidota bacterium]
MNKIYLRYLYLLLCAFSTVLYNNNCALAQNDKYDTVTVMHYNLMQYNVVSGPSCTPPTAAVRNPYLTSILGYVKPDVLIVNEMNDNEASADVILSAVTAAGGSLFKRAAYFLEPQDQLNTMLYYNSAKLQLTNTTVIGCSPRHAMLYQLKHIGTVPGITFKGSDVFITFVSIHLKASSTASDAADRATCANNIINFLNKNYEKTNNYIIQGDFNLYNSSEAAYQAFLNTINGIHFVDPLNRPGTWSVNSSFADIHTQSTRLNGTECFAGGGSDDRFDFILPNKSVLNDSLYAGYIPNSYKAIGQNGTHFNQSVNAGSNTAAPLGILNALYNVSDHLPVVLKLNITLSTIPSSIAKINPALVPLVMKGPYLYGVNNYFQILNTYNTVSGTVLLSTGTQMTIAGTNTHLTKIGVNGSYPVTVSGYYSITGSIMSFYTQSVIYGSVNNTNTGTNGIDNSIIPNPFNSSITTSGNEATLKASNNTVTGTYKFGNGTSRVTIIGINTYNTSNSGTSFYLVTIIGTSTFTGSTLIIVSEQIITAPGIAASLIDSENKFSASIENPFRNNVAVTLTDCPSGTYFIEMFNIYGQSVWQKEYDLNGDTKITLPMNALISGTYLLQINSEATKSIVKRIIKID